MGACLATEAWLSGMTVGSTPARSGGNQLAMAVGNAVLDVVLAPGFLDQVQRVANTRDNSSRASFRIPARFQDVEGKDLMLG